MSGRLKDYLLILAVCVTIIENMGGFPLYVTLTYFLVSLTDRSSLKTIINFKLGTQFCILWIVLFIYITIVTLLYVEHRDPLLELMKWFKAILLFSLVLKDTYNNPKLIYNIIVCYTISAFICAILMINGIGIDLYGYDFGEVRMTFLGTNENKMAMVYVFAFGITLYLLNEHLKKTIIVISCVFLMVLYMYIIANFASRGAFICIIIILTYYFIIYNKSSSFLKNVVMIIVGFIIIMYVFDYMTNIDVFSRRIEMTEEEEDYGGRDILINAAFKIFIDHSIFGVGLSQVMIEIYKITGQIKTPHNLYLYILAAGGMVGFSIFMTLIFKTLLFVYRYGHNKRLFLPVILIICVFIDFAKNGGALTCSINYAFYALTINFCLLSNKLRH